ncbi:MAG TPA: porin [Lacunisphaera sp.]|jgi:phosphate-selective porin OprO/OprP
MKIRSNPIRVSLIAAVILAGFTAARGSEADEIKLLREQIQLLDQKLQMLEQKQEQRDEAEAAAKKAAVAAPKPAPAAATASGNGFAITSADKAYDLKFHALFQFDARTFLDDGAPNRGQFLLRRIRTPLTGTVDGIYDFNITPELGGGTNSSTTVALWDAYAAARFSPVFGVRVGKFPSAVGLEPGANRHFMESPFVNSLLPNRDLGAEFFGGISGGVVEYRIGAFNGVANNTTNFGGASTDLNDGDKTIEGRLTVNPLKNVTNGVLSKVSLGFGFSSGHEQGVAGTNLSNGLSNINSQAQQAIFSYGSSLYANGQHVRVSPSVEWYPGNPFSFVAEYARDRQDISVNATAPVRTFTNTAWRGTVGYVLTGEAATKVGVNPKTVFNFSNGTWGAFEVVGRISNLSIDGDFFRPVAAGGAGINRANNVEGAYAYGIGLNWYLNRNFRFMVNLEQTNFAGGKTPTAAVGAQDDETALLSRIQLSF